jgi:hypothetical protein
MRVKIGDIWYSDKDQPVCVELSEKDKVNISNMYKEATKYASFPDSCSWTNDEKLGWMREEGYVPVTREDLNKACQKALTRGTSTHLRSALERRIEEEKNRNDND